METEKLHKLPPWAVVVITLGTVVGGCSRHLPPGEHNNFHPYGIEHAALHFEYFGDIRGSEDLYIDSFGNHEVHVINSALITEQGFHPTITYTVRNRENITVVDSVLHVEAKLKDRSMDSVYHLFPTEVPSPEAEFRNVFGPQGFKLVRDTSVLGLPAHIWEHSSTSDFLLEWRGIVVGNWAEIQGHQHGLRLLSIDTTTPIDPALFQPPSGFPIHDFTHQKPGQPMPPLNP